MQMAGIFKNLINFEFCFRPSGFHFYSALVEELPDNHSGAGSHRRPESGHTAVSGYSCCTEVMGISKASATILRKVVKTLADFRAGNQNPNLSIGYFFKRTSDFISSSPLPVKPHPWKKMERRCRAAFRYGFR